MLSSIASIALLVVLSSTGIDLKPIGAAFQEMACEKDIDCLENFYCYTVSHVCAPCKEDYCFIRNRNSSWRSCPHEDDECGPCLPGFQEEILSDGSPGKCLYIRTTSTTPNSPTATEGWVKKPNDDDEYRIGVGEKLVFFSFVALIVVVVVSLSAYIGYKWNTRTNTSNSRSIETQTPLMGQSVNTLVGDEFPPPYSSAKNIIASAPPLLSSEDFSETGLDPSQAPLLVKTRAPRSSNASADSLANESDNKTVYAHSVGPSCSNTADQEPSPSTSCSNTLLDSTINVPIERKKEESKNTQAVMFLRPDYEIEALEQDLSDVDEINNENNIETASISVHQPFVYEDESTQPSFWTPGPQYRTDSAENSSNVNSERSRAQDDEEQIQNKTKRISNELETKNDHQTKKIKLAIEESTDDLSTVAQDHPESSISQDLPIYPIAQDNSVSPLTQENPESVSESGEDQSD